MNDFVSQIRKIILYAGDIFLFYIVLAIVLFLRYSDRFNAELWRIHFWPFTIMFLIWLISFYVAGLYEFKGIKNDISFYVLLFQTLLFCGGLGIVYFYLFSSRAFNIRPQVVFFAYWIIFSILFLIWRRVYNGLAQAQPFLKNVLFIGAGKEMEKLAEELRTRPYLGYQVAGYYLHNGDAHSEAGNPGIPAGEEFRNFLKNKKVDLVVTSLELQKFPNIVTQLYQNLFLGIKYFDFPGFYEKVTGKVPVTTIGQLWFLENLSEKEKKFYEFSKRFVEIIFTLLFGIIGIILTPFIALVIKLDSRGPVFFRQARVGINGRVFPAIKFRTMVVGAEKNGAQWATTNDPRVTRVGKFLRKSRLDEIPQLINILRGEMSFIGPRPERPEFVAELTKNIPFYNERHLIKPGLSGWAQVNFKYGASKEDAMEKLQYDLYYIKNRSLALDFGILLKTINIVLSGKGQ